MRKISVDYCCEAASSGRLDPGSREHVLVQLRAEGHKRVESFLFERLFGKLVARCFAQGEVTSHWIFQTDGADVPRYWFRVITPAARWNALDDEVVAFLTGKYCHVAVVEHTEGSLVARSHGDADAPVPLPEFLARLLNRNRPARRPREYDHIDGEMQRASLEMIAQIFSGEELFDLSVSRTLINCHLYPWFGRQPMDVDAVVKSRRGFRFVEFKRKYPARDGRFGVDVRPHGVLADWLAEHGRPLLHVILNDPLWDKHQSPIHLLRDGSPTAPLADWIGVELTPDAFIDGERFQTRGADSGMLGGTRRQRKIRPDATRHLGQGLDPAHLGTFLQDSRRPPPRDLRRYLAERRDEARRRYAG